MCKGLSHFQLTLFLLRRCGYITMEMSAGTAPTTDVTRVTKIRYSNDALIALLSRGVAGGSAGSACADPKFWPNSTVLLSVPTLCSY